MKSILFFLVLASSPFCWADRMADWQIQVAEAQVRAAQINKVAKQNGGVVRMGQKIDCNGQDKVQLLNLKFKDGKSAEYIVVETDAYTWINRKLTVAKIENGTPSATKHQILFGASYGGWRWEREPEKASLGRSYNRFADVADLNLVESTLQKAAGCTPSPTPPRDEQLVGEVMR